MQLTWQKVKLPLKETFSIAYGNYSFRNALIVVLKKSGTIGYGLLWYKNRKSNC
ncbi:hypothetical protein [Flavobacterium columnare]|uniref:hypothetical protein n=1 Tax=Flavobacterium columnare TaxID=996 RepID=UPI001F316C9C|nr:hypothetical protein [Flavobacterium columnare]